MENQEGGWPETATPSAAVTGSASGISVAGIADKIDNQPPAGSQAKLINPIKAIRDKCIDCAGGSSKEVALCTCSDSCALWPFRFGKNPFRQKRTVSPEQKARLAAQLVRGREARHD
jgi:hypothetical protein